MPLTTSLGLNKKTPARSKPLDFGFWVRTFGGVKTCNQCKLELPPDHFHSKGKSRARDHICRDCRSERDRAEFLASLPPDKQVALLRRRALVALPVEVKIERQKEWSRKLSRDRYKMVAAEKRKPCADCGGIFHPHSMDFDHRDPSTKAANVSNLLKLTRREDLLREISKCDLVCSNCHRVRTTRRRAGLPATLPEPEYSI